MRRPRRRPCLGGRGVAPATLVVVALLAGCGGGDDLCAVVDDGEPGSLARFGPATDWTVAGQDVEALRAEAAGDLAAQLEVLGSFLGDTEAAFAGAGVEATSLQEVQQGLGDVPADREDEVAEALRTLLAAAADPRVESAYLGVASAVESECGTVVPEAP